VAFRSKLVQKQDPMAMPTWNEKISGGIYGALVGDALEVPVELSDRAGRDHDPVVGMRGYGVHDQPPVTWSDESARFLFGASAAIWRYNSRPT
jgi:ADP-ribosylglycohydrolase